MNVLSLCDGISCGRVALEKLGIKVDNYCASEIKPHAIECSKNNYPDIIHIGDVRNVFYHDGVLKFGGEGEEKKIKFDLVMFGSPCQTFSIAMPANKRIGLLDMKKSGIFYECYRILKEVSPKYFFVENVASMRDSDKAILSDYLGTHPIHLNSSDFSAQLRDRYYWTNIPQKQTEINLSLNPYKKSKITFQSILEYGYTNREKSRCLMTSGEGHKDFLKAFFRYSNSGFTNLIFKSEEHYKKCKKHFDTNYLEKTTKEVDKIRDHVEGNEVYDGIRYLTPKERERLQGLP